MKSITARILLVAALTAAPLQAQDPAAPATMPDFAKSVKERLGQLRAPAETASAGFPFGHFLKPPPPPPPENEDPVAQAEVKIVLPPEIKAQGTLNMGGRLVVVMQDGTHGVGDVVLGAKIKSINANEVVFEYRTRIFKLPVR